MAKDYGPLAKFSLSYDLVFLALIRIGLQDKGCSLCKRRCRFNPLKKCAMLCDADDGLKFTAGVAVMLTYFKLLDDVSDSSFFKGLFCRLLGFLYKPAYKKAKRFYPEAAAVIENAMAEQKKPSGRVFAISTEPPILRPRRSESCFRFILRTDRQNGYYTGSVTVSANGCMLRMRPTI